MSTTYNGWTNYETWVVKLWLDNDGTDLEEMARECLQAAIDDDKDRSDAQSAFASRIEGYVDELFEMSEIKPAGMFNDLLQHAIGMVDWREIADNVMSDIPVYSAGWNMPGYMPDNAPAQFLDADNARSYLSDRMREDMNELDADESDEDPQRDLVATELREQADALDALSTEGAAAEYGCTIGSTHYFLSLV